MNTPSQTTMADELRAAKKVADALKLIDQNPEAVQRVITWAQEAMKPDNLLRALGLLLEQHDILLAAVARHRDEWWAVHQGVQASQREQELWKVLDGTRYA